MAFQKPEKNYDRKKLEGDIGKLRTSGEMWGAITGIKEAEELHKRKEEEKRQEEQERARVWVGGRPLERQSLFSSMPRKIIMTAEMRKRDLKRGNVFERNGVQYRVLRVHRDGRTITAQRLPLGKIRQAWNISTRFSWLPLKKTGISYAGARKLKRNLRMQMRR